MLKQVVESRSGRTIALTGVASTIIYAVPAGKMFEGYITSGSATACKINGVDIPFTAAMTAPLPTKLFGGDTVLLGATSQGLLGVESWA